MSRGQLILMALLCLGFVGCRRTEPARALHHYQLQGRVVALNMKDHTATIDGAAVPNFMEAMTMEYPIKSRSALEHLSVGEHIRATIDVNEDGTYDLENIVPANDQK